MFVCTKTYFKDLFRTDINYLNRLCDTAINTYSTEKQRLIQLETIAFLGVDFSLFYDTLS